jgi:hypothetical protein
VGYEIVNRSVSIGQICFSVDDYRFYGHILFVGVFLVGFVELVVALSLTTGATGATTGQQLGQQLVRLLSSWLSSWVSSWVSFPGDRCFSATTGVAETAGSAGLTRIGRTC